MDKSEIINGANNLRKEHPYYRKGQSVFNYVEMTLGSVAREVQFLDNVDCFYDDSKIDDFIIASYKRYCENNSPNLKIVSMNQ